MEYSCFTYCFIQLSFNELSQICLSSLEIYVLWYICHILSKYFNSLVDWFFLNPHWESQKVSAVYGSNFISSALVNMLHLLQVRRVLCDYEAACRLPTLCRLQIMTFSLFWHVLPIPDIPYQLVNHSFLTFLHIWSVLLMLVLCWDFIIFKWIYACTSFVLHFVIWTWSLLLFDVLSNSLFFTFASD